MILVDRRIVASPTVVFAELENEGVLLDMNTGIYFGLDEVGTAMWQLIAGGAGEQSIVESLFSEYDVEIETLRADTSAFLGRLEQNGLVTISDV